MTRKETQKIAQYMLDIYSGILFNNEELEKGNSEEIIYEFD